MHARRCVEFRLAEKIAARTVRQEALHLATRLHAPGLCVCAAVANVSTSDGDQLGSIATLLSRRQDSARVRRTAYERECAAFCRRSRS